MSEQKNTADLAKRLRRIVGTEALIDESASMRPFECDGLSTYRQMPALVVLPQTVAEIQAVMRVCHEFDVPVVPRGAGTGLSAGATPHPQGVLLSLAKFNQVLAIDPVARTARVQPGVRNAQVTEAVSKHRLYYAPDPSSQIACSIGGNVAENAGGVHCLKYGLTLHNILKVQMVSVEGELLELGSEGLDSAGFDLLALITGSEGLLGILTEITVKLLPEPDTAKLIMAAFDDVEKASNAVAAVIAAGIVPAGLEMMDSLAIIAAEDFCHPGYPRDAAALLLCELDGCEAEVSEQVEQVQAVFNTAGATRTHISRDEQERALLWKGRKSAFPAVGRISADYYCMDGTIPRGQLAYVLKQIGQFSNDFNLRIANVFHAGDGNLHPLILFDNSVPGEFEKAEALGGKILELCVEVGGCITGEHGVGLEKLRQMPVQFSDTEISQFHAIKAAFDPAGRLNPGKGVPLLKHCQEFRLLEANHA